MKWIRNSGFIQQQGNTEAVILGDMAEEFIHRQGNTVLHVVALHAHLGFVKDARYSCRITVVFPEQENVNRTSYCCKGRAPRNSV